MYGDLQDLYSSEEGVNAGKCDTWGRGEKCVYVLGEDTRILEFAWKT